jgi:hypothetical protein
VSGVSWRAVTGRGPDVTRSPRAKEHWVAKENWGPMSRLAFDEHL